jgi:uncharacterized UBP type Zn finger protein
VRNAAVGTEEALLGCVLQVPVEVNVELLQQLKDMGFGETRAARGLHFSGNSTLEVRGGGSGGRGLRG